jgi:hypothetical protein
VLEHSKDGQDPGGLGRAVDLVGDRGALLLERLGLVFLVLDVAIEGGDLV